MMIIIIIINVYQHIRMISEGSCDTEDWRNDAENVALITGINYILKYIQIVKIFHSISACCILDQINAGLVSRSEFFKNIKNLTVQKLLTVSVLTCFCFSVCVCFAMIQSAQGTVMMSFFQLVHPRDQDLSFVLLKRKCSTIKKNIIRTNAHEL